MNTKYQINKSLYLSLRKEYNTFFHKRKCLANENKVYEIIKNIDNPYNFNQLKQAYIKKKKLLDKEKKLLGSSRSQEEKIINNNFINLQQMPKINQISTKLNFQEKFILSLFKHYKKKIHNINQRNIFEDLKNYIDKITNQNLLIKHSLSQNDINKTKKYYNIFNFENNQNLPIPKYFSSTSRINRRIDNFFFSSSSKKITKNPLSFTENMNNNFNHTILNDFNSNKSLFFQKNKHYNPNNMTNNSYFNCSNSSIHIKENNDSKVFSENKYIKNSFSSINPLLYDFNQKKCSKWHTTLGLKEIILNNINNSKISISKAKPNSFNNQKLTSLSNSISSKDSLDICCTSKTKRQSISINSIKTNKNKSLKKNSTNCVDYLNKTSKKNLINNYLELSKNVKNEEKIILKKSEILLHKLLMLKHSTKDRMLKDKNKSSVDKSAKNNKDIIIIEGYKANFGSYNKNNKKNKKNFFKKNNFLYNYSVINRSIYGKKEPKDVFEISKYKLYKKAMKMKSKEESL